MFEAFSQQFDFIPSKEFTCFTFCFWDFHFFTFLSLEISENRFAITQLRNNISFQKYYFRKKFDS